MDNSPFSRLPPEIRNHIYSLTLAPASAHPIHIPAHRSPPYKKRAGHDRHLGALRYTCSEIRGEYTRMFYASNVFTVDAIGSSNDRPTLLKRLTAFHNFIEASRMTNLKMTIDVDFGIIGPDDHVSRITQELRSIAHLSSVLALRGRLWCHERKLDGELGCEGWELDVPITGVLGTLQAFRDAASSAAERRPAGGFEWHLRCVHRSLIFEVLKEQMEETRQIFEAVASIVTEHCEKTMLLWERIEDSCLGCRTEAPS